MQIELRRAGYDSDFSLVSLIEACGEDFIELQHPTSGQARRLWYALAKADTPPWPHGVGLTPEEAVARLWLALNNKAAALWRDL
ncbi:MAG TPA: hypothetical protein VE665_04140 [Hyphomicrobiaceae bacterium]|nr:hypothetical protein [Hyphomicrobiaceae bacterium]